MNCTNRRHRGRILLRIIIILLFVISILHTIDKSIYTRIVEFDVEKYESHRAALCKGCGALCEQILPSNETIRRSMVLDYLYVYDSTNVLERPSHYLRIKMCIKDAELFVDETSRLKEISTEMYEQGNRILFVLDEELITSLEYKMDDIVFDGCRCLFPYALIEDNDTISYCFFAVPDAGCRIDDLISGDLLMLSEMINQGE